MIRRIDDADLSILLKDKSKYIGTHKIWDCILDLASVVIAALGILGFPFSRRARIVLIIIWVILIVGCLRDLVITVFKPYDSNRLMGDIMNLDRTERRSSIIALTDGSSPSRYLLYKDTGWDCDFFPNVRTQEPSDADQKHVREWFSKEYGVPLNSIRLVFKTSHESHKPSTEHNGQERYYVYNIYQATLAKLPDAWKKDTFSIGSRECVWMTLDQMNTDPRIREVNSDVVSAVKSVQ
ncbi:MAG: hypothetical protein ACFN0Z_03315 [Parascardovia denticolens]